MYYRGTSGMRAAEIASNIELDEYVTGRRRSYLNRPIPWKTTMAAIFLLVIGSVFLILGFSILFDTVVYHGKDRGIAIIVLGGIMFIPGSYASVILYGSWKGWEGYDYSMIPSYDDDQN